MGLGISLGGGFAQSGGILEVAGHNLSVDNLWQVGGTLEVRSGTLALGGTNIIDGTAVAPELVLDGGNTTIGSAVTAQTVFENNLSVEAGAVLAGSRLVANGEDASLSLSTGSTNGSISNTGTIKLNSVSVATSIVDSVFDNRGQAAPPVSLLTPPILERSLRPQEVCFNSLAM